MRIKYSQPWFWPIISYLGGGIDFNNVIFTFGDVVYSNKTVRADLFAHETVHMKQMRGSKIIAVFFHLACMLSKKFRLRMEIPAYQAQLEYIKGMLSSASLIEKARVTLAKHMTSEVYGGMITYEEAYKLLQ